MAKDRRKKKKKSPYRQRVEARLRETTQEIQGMVSSGAATHRPKKLKKLQEEGGRLRTRVRELRRAADR